MKKNLLPLYFIIGSVFIGLVVFIAFSIRDLEKTVPKIKLSYFKDLSELSDSIYQRLQLELELHKSSDKQFWLGVEPQKKNHLELASTLLLALQKSHEIKTILVDKQLGLSEEELKMFPGAEIIEVKDEWSTLSDRYASGNLKASVVITAAIYSTSLLNTGPIFKIKEKTKIKPMTFSFGHFAIDLEDEKNNLFPCGTEDRTGVNKWACTLINKARSQRRRIQPLSEVHNKPFLGLMDLTGERDYMVLFTNRAN